MANSDKSRSRQRQAQRGGERMSGRIELTQLAGFAAAGHNIGVDDLSVTDEGMFPEGDVDTGLERPQGGVWSFGPPKV